MPNNNKLKFNVKIRSKVHPGILHEIKINLRCNEKLPNESELNRHKICVQNKTAKLNKLNQTKNKNTIVREQIDQPGRPNQSV